MVTQGSHYNLTATYNGIEITDYHIPDAGVPYTEGHVAVGPTFYPGVGIYPLEICLDNRVTDPPQCINKSLPVDYFIEDPQVDCNPTHIKTGIKHTLYIDVFLFIRICSNKHNLLPQPVFF